MVSPQLLPVVVVVQQQQPPQTATEASAPAANDPYDDKLPLSVLRSCRAAATALLEQTAREMHAVARSVRSTLRPAATGGHWLLFTPTLTLALLLAHTAMLAQAQAKPPDAGHGEPVLNTSDGSDPAAMWRAIERYATRALPSTMLRAWGSLYAPDIARGQAARWFTSQLVHSSVWHLASNLVLVAGLGMPLERQLGWWRVAAAWQLGVLGGALSSVALEAPCVQVVGASAGVLGLLGLSCAELAARWRALRLPLMQFSGTLLLLAVIMLSTSTSPGISRASHVGGLLGGGLPSLLWLPAEDDHDHNDDDDDQEHGAQRDARLRRSPLVQHLLRAVGVAGLIVPFSVLPVYAYVLALPAAAAACDN